MNLKTIIQHFVRTLVNKSPKGYHNILKTMPFIIRFIRKTNKKLSNKKYTTGTHIYWFINGITDFPRCKNPKCNKPLTRNVIVTTGYCAGYCGTKCEMTDVNHQEKLQLIFNKKYGSDYYTSSIEFSNVMKAFYNSLTSKEKNDIQIKREKTTIKNHNVKNILASKEARAKWQEKSLLEHGTKTWNNPEKIKTTKAENRKKDPQYQTRINAKRKQTIEDLKQKDPQYQQQIEDKRKNTITNRKSKDPNYQQNITRRTIQTNIKKIGYSWPSQSPEIRSKMSKKYYYNGIRFDSAPEIAFYIWLTDHKIQFEYQPTRFTFEYHTIDGNSHIYHPDFYLVDSKQLIEIKGDHFFKRVFNSKVNQAKLNLLKKLKIKILKSKDYKVYEDYCCKKFNDKKWKLKFKVY